MIFLSSLSFRNSIAVDLEWKSASVFNKIPDNPGQCFPNLPNEKHLETKQCQLSKNLALAFLLQLSVQPYAIKGLSWALLHRCFSLQMLGPATKFHSVPLKFTSFSIFPCTFPFGLWNSHSPWDSLISSVTFSLYNPHSILLFLFILWLTPPEKPFAIPYYEEFPIKINYIVLCLGDKLDGINSCTQQLCANKFKAKSNQMLSVNPLRAEISCCTTQQLPYRKPSLLGEIWKNCIARWSKPR